MKPSIRLFLTPTLAGLLLVTDHVRAQQTLRTDPAGNPLSALNLGGGNVTGTLAAERLPANIGLPIVQIVSQTEGSVAVAPATNVVVLGAALAGPLHLQLSDSATYGAARALVIVDAGNYTSVSQPVIAEPAGSDLLNGSPNPLLVLAGTGTASLYTDGAGNWSVGQSRLRAATSAGLVVAGPAASGQDSTLLAVHDSTDAELFAVRGSGGTVVGDLAVNNTLSSDLEAISSDGAGGLTVNSVAAVISVSTPGLCLGNGPALPPAGSACLYFASDGLIHALTPDGVNHVLTWTTASGAH